MPGSLLTRLAALSAAALLLPIVAAPAPAEASGETTFLDLVNEARAADGKAPLVTHWDLTDDAVAHSETMRAHEELFHNPDLADVTTGWSLLGENVGVGPDVETLFDLFMGSPGHRANILGPYTYIGIGIAPDNGYIWLTAVFMEPDDGGSGYPFDDIAQSPFLDDILWLTEDGTRFACNPPANDLFCPTAPVEREWMAEFVAKTLGLPPASTDYFTDDNGSPFEDSINRVAEAGVSYGCNPPHNDRFCPDRILTRGEMAAFFVRALELSDAGAGDYFTDDDDSVFESDIDKIATAGVTFGCNPPANDLYCVDRILSRGEIAAFLHRGVG